MNNYFDLNSIFDIIGTIAFAISGALFGAKKNMDVLGVLVLGIVTALGGGFIRDLVLGITPPNMFQNSTNAIIATLSSLLVFLILYIKTDKIDKKLINHLSKIMTISDTIGLASFTITGIATAISVGYEEKFLLIFVGTVTGVGGGAIRDVLSGSVPFIFREQIYAGACILGSFVFLIVRHFVPTDISLIICFLTVLIVRLIAVKKNLNLPKITD